MKRSEIVLWKCQRYMHKKKDTVSTNNVTIQRYEVMVAVNAGSRLIVIHREVTIADFSQGV